MESVVTRGARPLRTLCRLLPALAVGLCAALRAQTPESAWEAAYEALAETQAEDEAATAVLALEALQERLDHPLCINTATYDELEALGLLTPWEIEALLRYRTDYGLIVGA
ncbi:MAG: hypothetical protein K2O46_05705, partial [Bacteroidales bacterium]|nr:hypothetical protein [Bacteroidales bacterium]